MHKEELVYITCDMDHNFAVRLDQVDPSDLEQLNCPICSGYVTTEMTRTVLVATGYKDLIALDEALEKYTTCLNKAEAKVAGLNMTIRVTDIEEVKTLVESAIELDRLIKGCDNKFQIDNSVELHLFRNALDGLAKLAARSGGEKRMTNQGQLSSPEIADMHLDGTLCEQCGEYLGDPVGYPRLCKGCED